MDILVCVKRVPTVGGTLSVTPDGLAVDTRMSGFTISPHEECAVEEAVRLASSTGGSVAGGSVTVVTVGPESAEEQLRACLAVGATAAVLVETGPGRSGLELGPMETAACLASVASSRPFDLVLLGNEAADTGDYQVGVRLAYLLGRPVVTGIKSLSVSGSVVTAARGNETFTVPLPCVVTVREGLNLPRYPSLPGRLRAKRAVISRVPADGVPGVSGVSGDGVRVRRLRVPSAPGRAARVLGHGVDAVPALVSVLAELGVVP